MIQHKLIENETKKKSNMEIIVKHLRPNLLFVTGKWKVIDKYYEFYVVENNKKIKVLPDDFVREELLTLTVWNDNKTGTYIKEEDVLQYKVFVEHPKLTLIQVENITVLKVKCES